LNPQSYFLFNEFAERVYREENGSKKRNFRIGITTFILNVLYNTTATIIYVLYLKSYFEK